MKKEISVCNECGKPVVWTFAFDGAEYYCLMCGNKTGMMGGKTDVPWTPELRAWQIVVEKVWKSLRHFHTGSGRYRQNGCKKCISEDHGHHFKDMEIEKMKVVNSILEKLNK